MLLSKFEIIPSYAHVYIHYLFSDDIDLLYVTVHEIGHSIGIGHSSVSGAIMYPTYAKVATVKLHSDDINAARAQYGK